MNYLIGDIIKITDDEGYFEYHLVWDVNYIGDTEIQESLETAVIFPIEEDIDDDIVELKLWKDSIDILANISLQNGEILIESLNKKRSNLGYYEIPRLTDIRIWKKSGYKESKNPFKHKNTKETKQLKDFPQVQDIIRYDELTSINECLDAMNDLKTLHNMFGDEAYIQLGELVAKRLEVLSK